MKVVSVINYKGGVGKTTVTANLAVYAASKGKRVLMIDLDLQGSLTFLFSSSKNRNADKNTLKNFFEDCLNNNANLSLPVTTLSCIDRRNNQNNFKFWLSSSHSNLENIAVQLEGIIQNNKTNSIKDKAINFLKHYSHLLHGLEGLRNNYDLVLIDCPPNFNSLVKNAITASDYCLIPTRMDLLSASRVEEVKNSIHKHISEYREYIEMFGQQGYNPLKAIIMGIVPTMITIFNGQPVQTNQVYINELRDKFYIFPFIRYNATIFGSDKALSIPVVLLPPRNAVGITIKSELEKLGDDFIKRAGI